MKKLCFAIAAILCASATRADLKEDLNELDDEQRNLFMADVADVTRAMQQLFKPEKINYGAYSDKLSHLHFHLAPKYVDGPDYGGTFRMNPGEVYLTEAEYDEMVQSLRRTIEASSCSARD